MMEDPETKIEVETLYELLKDDEKKQLGKNNKAKITLYNALPRKEYEQVFMCKTSKEVWHTLIITHQGISQVKDCKTDLLTQQYKNLKSLDQDYSSKNHVRKFLYALSLKWKAKVTAIEEAKDLATLPLDELIGNLKVYEMILENDGVASKTTKEKVKSLSLKAKVTMEQTSDDSDSQRGSDEDVNKDESKAFNLIVRNFRKNNRFGYGNRFGNRANRLRRGCEMVSRTKAAKAQDKGESDSEDGDEPQNDATCLMAVNSQEVRPKPSTSKNKCLFELHMDNEELLMFSKDFSKTYEKLLKEKHALEKEHSKLFSKVNKLELEVKNLAKSKEVCLKCDLLLDDWIIHTGCTKHMIRNRRLFTSYKAYDGGHVAFGSNLKGKVIGRVAEPCLVKAVPGNHLGRQNLLEVM
ncbi:hypothetical protein Tco_0694746 [Tanacetum coccineum]